jgi:RHS repeat-associated protein
LKNDGGWRRRSSGGGSSACRTRPARSGRRKTSGSCGSVPRKWPEGTINYGYDATTGQHTRTWTDNSDITYHYDLLGRLDTVAVTKQNAVRLTTPQVTTYTYNEVGALKTETLPNGVGGAYSYDVLNRLTDLVQQTSGGTLLASYHYTYTADNQKATVDEIVRQVDGTTQIDRTVWQYDPLGRLWEEAYTNQTDPSLDYTTDYVYDLVGNRLQKLTTNNSGSDEADSQYNAADELFKEIGQHNGSPAYVTDFAYDLNGSLTSQITGGGGESDVYSYNARNQLTGAVIDRGGSHIVTAYQYDDAGMRVRDTVTTTPNGGTATTDDRLWLEDENNPTGYAQVNEERTVSGSLLASFVYGLNPLTDNQSGVVAHYVEDGYSGVRALANGSGMVLASYRYDGFGVITAQAGSFANPILYQAQRFDAALGQYYNRARIYAQETGRFTSMDPVLGHASDPISLHRYAYAADDPIQFIDPSGRETATEVNIVIVIGLALTIDSFIRHIQYGTRSFAKGDYMKAAQEWVWAACDLFMLAYPFSGPSSKLQVETEAATYEVEALMAADLAPTAIWGYLDTTFTRLQESDVGNGWNIDQAGNGSSGSWGEPPLSRAIASPGRNSGGIIVEPLAFGQVNSE